MEVGDDAPQGTASESVKPQPREVCLAVVQLDYQVTQDLVKMLTDIRFRLLNILPPISAASVTLVSAQTFGGLSPLAMLAVGLMGFFITLGLILYDQRNSDLYNACIHRATILEGVLGFVRRGDEILKSEPSADVAATASAIASEHPGAGGQRQTDKVEPSVWAGGPHRQRAVKYLRFLDFEVSHGSALSLVYGVVLGAWIFPIMKGALVLAASALLLRGNTPVSNGSGLATSASALLLAAAGAYAFRRSLEAADAPGTVTKLYPDVQPDDRGETWGKYAKQYAAERVAERAVGSLTASLLVSTDSGKTAWGRLVDWWSRRNGLPPETSAPAPTVPSSVGE